MGVVINVVEDGVAHMQGKTIETIDSTWFLHSANVNQWHYESNSPCGIDVCVLRWLVEHGIDSIHFHDRSRDMLRTTTIALMRAHGRIETSRGTSRCFLPDNYWQAYPLINNKLPYEVPHIRQEVTLEPVAVKSTPTPKRTTPKPMEQAPRRPR